MKKTITLLLTLCLLLGLLPTEAVAYCGGHLAGQRRYRDDRSTMAGRLPVPAKRVSST